MADRDSIYRWLRAKSFRWVTPSDPAYAIVLRLVKERRAICLSPNRYRAMPTGGTGK